MIDSESKSGIIAGNQQSAKMPKSKGADLPQSRRPTLQSQFSQGESMNECILKILVRPWVAKILRSDYENLAAGFMIPGIVFIDSIA
jgi:hypothetical protein